MTKRQFSIRSGNTEATAKAKQSLQQEKLDLLNLIKGNQVSNNSAFPDTTYNRHPVPPAGPEIGD